jgi:predicted signal transduction protein with EAL and GGDEF domain
VVIHPDVDGAPDVMRHADMALYRAKNEGRNRACIYDSAMDEGLVKRKVLEQELRSAMESNALHVAYQPILNHTGERVVGSRRSAAGRIRNRAKSRRPNSFLSQSTAA